MAIKFDDIMKKFYDDPKLGIKKEEAPANASGSAVAGTGDDSDTVVVKKKKNPYDGRTKEARQFYNRMSERRAKREEKSRLAKQVQENTLSRASHLVEDNIDALRKIVKDRQAGTLKFKDGTMKVDGFTASAIVQVYDALNKMNQEKVSKLLNDKKANFMKMADFAFSKVK